MKYQLAKREYEAVFWSGDNLQEVLDFVGKHPKWDEWFGSFEEYKDYVEVHGNNRVKIWNERAAPFYVSPDNWILKDQHGMFFTERDSTFKKHYLPVDPA